MSEAAVRSVRPALGSERAVRASLLPVKTRCAASSRAKRFWDVTGALAALLLFLPLMLAIAAAISLETGGPVIFRQRRTGRHGQVFTILKFRTMTVAEDAGEIRQATRNDARITPLGGLLRKLSLDELPQLFNVLKGDMSFVGPRPHAVAHDVQYGGQIPGYADRFRARPGLTGLAQVNGLRGEIHDLEGMRQRVTADNAYIDSWSIGLDAQILARTLVVVFRDPQAY